MRTYKRLKNRKSNKIKSDILSTQQILREDVADLISPCSSKEEAIEVIRTFFSSIDDTEIFKLYGKDKSIERIVSDIDSYKTWEDPA